MVGAVLVVMVGRGEEEDCFFSLEGQTFSESHWLDKCSIWEDDRFTRVREGPVNKDVGRKDDEYWSDFREGGGRMMVTFQNAIHEAAHAVLAVKFELPFECVIAGLIPLKEGGFMPGGVVNLSGGPDEMRVVALAGWTAQVKYQSEFSVSKGFPPIKDQRAKVRMELAPEQKDMDAYVKHGGHKDSEQFESELEKANVLVLDCWDDISAVATGLMKKNNLTKDEVVALMGTEKGPGYFWDLFSKK